MMSHLFSVRATIVRATLGAVALTVGVVGTALADSAPQISLSGPIYTTFVQVRPYIAAALFAYGVYAIFHYAYHAGRVRMRKVANGGLEGGTEELGLPSVHGFLNHIAFVVIMIALLMAVMFAGLDVFNALLKFIWSTASGSTLSV
jgi:hypothetical protein